MNEIGEQALSFSTALLDTPDREKRPVLCSKRRTRPLHTTKVRPVSSGADAARQRGPIVNGHDRTV